MHWHRHGPAKPPSEEGLDEELLGLKLDASQQTPERGPNYNADPLGKRTGEAPEAVAADTLNSTLDEVRLRKSIVLCCIREALSEFCDRRWP